MVGWIKGVSNFWLKLNITKTAPNVACGFVFNNELFISPQVFTLFSRYNICKKRRSSWRHLNFDEREKTWKKRIVSLNPTKRHVSRYLFERYNYVLIFIYSYLYLYSNFLLYRSYILVVIKDYERVWHRNFMCTLNNLTGWFQPLFVAKINRLRLQTP